MSGVDKVGGVGSRSTGTSKPQSREKRTAVESAADRGSPSAPSRLGGMRPNGEAPGLEPAVFV
jgi:hypothetical protein